MAFDFDELYPNRFMKAGELKGRDVTLTIKEVLLEELDGKKGPQMKGILSFERTSKQLTLNKTNGLCIREMFGRATADWIGKRITIYPQAVDYEDCDLAIRVRGSPDIAAPITFTLELSRKKPRKVTLQKTGQPAAPAKPNGKAPEHAVASPQTVPEPPPDMDPLTGEVPFN
jgi:hypothetical protein